MKRQRLRRLLGREGPTWKNRQWRENNCMSEGIPLARTSFLARITAPTLVVGTWVGLRQYKSREQVGKGFREQYAPLADYKFVMSEKAKRFVMFDDPEFLFGQTDNFLAGESRKNRKQ